MIKSSGGSGSPLEGILLEELDKRSCNKSIMTNKSMAIPGKAKEASQLFESPWNRPSKHS